MGFRLSNGRAAAETLSPPALKTRWELSIDGQPSTLHVEEVVSTMFNVDVNSAVYGGRGYDFPGFASMGHVSMVLYEDESLTAIDFMLKWQRKVFDPRTHSYGLPVNYRKNMKLMLYKIENADKPSLIISLLESWPIAVQPYDFAYSAVADRNRASVTLSVTNIDHKFGDRR